VTGVALEQVTFRYPGAAVPALRDVSCAVRGGELVMLIGVAGAGCSTALLVAAGLAPRVTGGTLRGAVRCAPHVERGLLLPTPWTQVSGMAFTVRDEVAFGPANLGWPVARVRAATEAALGRMGVTALADRDPATLSGGELQRVVLAGLLAMEPAVVLLDEPTAELDPAAAQGFWGTARALADEGRAVLAATTDLDAVARADRVVWLDAGAVRADGPPAVVFAGDALWHDGPGGPVIAELWRAARLTGAPPLTIAAATARVS
jgi:energy-coupling factor transporter ATP-binding protein EcfA2